MRIWSYSLDPMDSGKLVPIKSVCVENFLYEIRGEDGELLAPNVMESILSQFEGMFAKELRTLQRKAQYKENYKTKCFFTAREKAFWKLYVTIQMMREPNVIREAHDYTKSFLGDQLNERQISALAISQCLPFFSKLEPEDKSAFSAFLQPLLSMSIAIGVDESGTLFTSDNPVYCYTPQKDIVQTEYERIVMPLTSELVLILLGGELAKAHDKNRLFPLDNEGRESVKLAIAYSARSRVFSERALGKTDREIIEQARKDKAEDKAAQRG